MDKSKSSISGILIMMAICIVVILLLYNRNDTANQNTACYNLHVYECEQAHLQNMTYMLCSGINVEPSVDDEKVFCKIGLNESCSKIIPKECLI